MESAWKVEGVSGNTSRGTRGSLSSPGYVVGLVAVFLFAGALVGSQLWSEQQILAGDTATLIGKGNVLLEDALRSDDTETYAAASTEFEAALDVDPQSAEALRGAAIADLGLHRFNKAHALANAAVTLAPHDHIALAALVDANIELGLYDQAAVSLDELLALRPGLQAYTRLSYLRQLTGDDAGALEAMYLARSTAEGLQPESARVEALLGELHSEFGDYAAAARHYSAAIELDPSRLDAMVGLAVGSWETGRQAAATVALEEVFALDPENTEGLMLAAEINRVGGNHAAADRQAALVTDAAMSEHLAGYGVDPSVAIFAASWGDRVVALELAQIGYAARPENIKIAHALAWALHQSDRTAEAAQPLATALRFGRTDSVFVQHQRQILDALE